MGDIFSRQLNSPPNDKGVRRWSKQEALRHMTVQSSNVVERTSAVMTAGTDVQAGWVRGVTLENRGVAFGYVTATLELKSSTVQNEWHCPGCGASRANVGQKHLRYRLLCQKTILHCNNWATTNFVMACRLIVMT